MSFKPKKNKVKVISARTTREDYLWLKKNKISPSKIIDKFLEKNRKGRKK